MVPRAGLEPATIGLEVHCSIQLSYRGVLLVYGYVTLKSKTSNGPDARASGPSVKLAIGQF